MRTQDSSEISSSSSIVHRQGAKLIVIDGRDDIHSVAVLADGKHIMSGGAEQKIRRWRTEDGKEVGTAMDAGSRVLNIAVSRDGKVIVIGTGSGLVTVWNVESHSKLTEFKADRGYIRAVDVSPDATKIATGSDDVIVSIWSLPNGKRLLGPLKHSFGRYMVAAKFSPDGCLIATATWDLSVRVYDSQNGSLLVEFPVRINSSLNQCLAWASDSKQLFALSRDGYIYCVDVSVNTTLSKWLIQSSNYPRCIALATNGTFIAAAADSSVSLWDTTTHEQIGAVIEYTHAVGSMVMSPNYDLVTSGNKKITLRALCNTLPSHYLDNVSVPA